MATIIYAVSPVGGSPLGVFYCRTRREADTVARRIANERGHARIDRITVGDLRRRELIVRLLNHSRWAEHIELVAEVGGRAA